MELSARHRFWYLLLAVVGLLCIVIFWQASLPFISSNSTPSQKPPKPHPAPKMSLEQKVAGLLFVGVSSPKMATQTAKLHVGGYLLRTDSGLFDAKQVATLKELSGNSPLVAVDEEGGKVDRLPGQEFSSYSAAALGLQSNAQVYSVATTIGDRLRAIGATVNFAPVVDIDDGQNAAIAQIQRSFSADPTVIAEKAGAFADGLRHEHIAPTFKHFPGLGRATGSTGGNTDTASAVAPPLESLKTSDLLPYKSLITTQPCLVMVGNQIVPNLTDDGPASLSPATYALLRNEYQFTGVAVTDELYEAKATRSVLADPSQLVIAALKAGADMPLVNASSATQVSAIIANVSAAVRSGTLSEATIDKSLTRIAALKMAL